MRRVSVVLFALAAPIAARAADATDGGSVVSGYMQVDYQRSQASVDEVDEGSGASLNEDQFAVRRARVTLDYWRDRIAFRGQLHASTLGEGAVGVRHLEGLLTLRKSEAPDGFSAYLGAGIFPVPFGYEVYAQDNTDRLFTERTLLARAFVPGEYDLGARLWGSVQGIDWVVALQNGEPVSDDAFPRTDPNRQKDLAGRVSTRAGLGSFVRLSGGLSALTGHGFHPGTRPTKDTLVWRDYNEDGIVQLSELQNIRGAAGSPSRVFDRWGIGADLQVTAAIPGIGSLTTYGEIATAVNLDRGVQPADPVVLGRDQRGQGWYVALVLDVQEWGVVGSRYEQYDPNLDSFDVQAGETVLERRPFSVWTVTAGVPLRTGSAIGARVLLEYSRIEDSLGRDASGRPADLRNDVVRARMEVRL